MSFSAWQKAWGIWALAILLAIVALVARLANYDRVIGELDGVDWWSEIIWWNILVPLAGPAFATTGAFIAARRPENWVGWLSLTTGLLIPVQDIIWNYSVYALHDNSSEWPAGTLIGLLANVTGPPVVLLLFSIVLLLFPTGTASSPRWRLGLWFALALLALNSVVGLLSTNVGLTLDGPAENPIAIKPIGDVAERIHGALQFVTPLILLASIASTFVRHHRARGVERNQLKWVSYVAAFIGASLILGVVAYALTGFSYVFLAIFSVFIGSIAVLIPSAIGIAILRYRLLDIDVVINRTAVYSMVMLVLASAYTVSVVSLQALMGSIAGSSGIAVAASTLAAVALFQPLRVRIQHWVDRRFYRTRYSASIALSQFGQTVRDEVDLDRLQVVICRLITDTVQPEQITFWVPDQEHGSVSKGQMRRAR